MNAFILHASIVIYYVIAWIGLLRVDYDTANDPRLLVMKSLEFRYLTVWNFVSITTFIISNSLILSYSRGT